jgi:hypothetical protein
MVKDEANAMEMVKVNAWVMVSKCVTTKTV